MCKGCSWRVCPHSLVVKTWRGKRTNFTPVFLLHQSLVEVISISAAAKRARLLCSAVSVHTPLYTIAGSGGKCTTYCFHASITGSNGSCSQYRIGILLPCLT